MLVHHRVTPSIKFTNTHLYTWVERCTVRVKCITQEHNKMSSPLNVQPSALTMRPPHLFMWLEPFTKCLLSGGVDKHRSDCISKLMHNKKVQCRFKVAFKLHYFWDLGTYMINIKLLGILSRLRSFALFNDNLFNKLFVSGPLKYK